MRRINGGCHCGNISFEFLWPAEGPQIPVRVCSCTFCTKHRGTYTSHPEARLEVAIADPDRVNRYRFATATADFWVCSSCGVVPFVTSTIDHIVYAVVNANTFDAADPITFRSAVTNFDGETLEDRLERRKRTWIPDVVICEPADDLRHRC